MKDSLIDAAVIGLLVGAFTAMIGLGIMIVEKDIERMNQHTVGETK